MTKEEIEEGNKLIAEFMGETIYKENNVQGFKHLVKLKNPTNGKSEYWSMEGVLDWLPPFHKSWDWLMPVVEKIEKMGYGVVYECYDGKSCSVRINHERERSLYSRSYIDKKIECYYYSAINFIKWHNTQTTHK